MHHALRTLAFGLALTLASGPAFAASDAAPSGTIITPVLEKPLPDVPGKVVSMITVEYAPGAETPPHRHDAHTFVYVLSGRLLMAVEGQETQELSAGQSFYESPNDVHSVSRNASDSEPAKFLVFFLKPADAELLTPVQ